MVKFSQVYAMLCTCKNPIPPIYRVVWKGAVALGWGLSYFAG